MKRTFRIWCIALLLMLGVAETAQAYAQVIIATPPHRRYARPYRRPPYRGWRRRPYHRPYYRHDRRGYRHPYRHF